jgi:tetratricopeptide (TPR) repeat protein
VNHAFRLIEAQQLKAALTDSAGVLAVIVSGWFYDEVVHHSPLADAAAYQQITATVKETTGPAWIYLPDGGCSCGGTPVEPAASPVSDRPTPKQIPARPGSFTGRTAELAALTKVLDAAGANHTMAISVIAGMGGIGKSWLAFEWAHRTIDRFPDGQLYVNLRGFDPSGEPLAPAVAIRRVLDALEVPPASIPVDAEAQEELYRSQVAGRRMLIVLDNARDSSQVLPLLPASPHCMVLITTREQLSGLVTAHDAVPVPLGVLDELHSRQLLANRLGNHRLAAEPAAVDKLVKYCAGLPLALAIVAAHAAQAEFPLDVIASELGRTSLRGKVSVQLDALDGGEPTANLRVVLSWSYQVLTEDAAEVFRLLGLVPGTDISTAAAAVLTGRTESGVAVVVKRLEKSHLVQRTPKRYRMHDLIRLYAAELAEAEGPELRETVLRRLISFYVHATYAGERLLYPDRKDIEIGRPPAHLPMPQLGDDGSVLAWFDTEHHCLLAAQEVAVKQGWCQQVWELAWTMHGYLWRRGHLQEQLDTWRRGLAAARQLGDTAKQGVASRLLGQAYARAGVRDKAEKHLHEALVLARKTGDTHGEARAHHDLTWVWRDIDDRKALDHATEALRLFRTLDRPVWEAEALSMVSWHLAQLGRYEEARTACDRAYMLFRQEKNRQGQADTLDYLGYIELRCGDHRSAVTHLRESYALCRDLGATYQEADTLDHLGQALLALGHRQEARGVWQQALRLLHGQNRDDDARRIARLLSQLNDGQDPTSVD